MKPQWARATGDEFVFFPIPTAVAFRFVGVFDFHVFFGLDLDRFLRRGVIELRRRMCRCTLIILGQQRDHLVVA